MSLDRTHEPANPASLNLRETADGNRLMASFDMSGIPRENITIGLQGDGLIVSGASVATEAEETDTQAMRQRQTGTFSRRIPIPSELKVDDIDARMDGSVLTVSFPKKE